MGHDNSLAPEGFSPEAVEEMEGVIAQLAGVVAEGQHQELGLEAGDALQGLLQRRLVAVGGQFFRQGEVEVVPPARVAAPLLGETAEIRVDETGMAMYGDGRHVGPLAGDDLARRGR